MSTPEHEEGERNTEVWRQAPEGVAPKPALELARGPCFGTCPIYEVAIYRDGAVVYRGGGFVAVLGEVRDSVAPADVAQMVDFAERNGFFDLDDKCPLRVIDEASVTVTVHSGSRAKTVFMEGDLEEYFPRVFQDLAQGIDRLAGVQRWVGQREWRARR